MRFFNLVVVVSSLAACKSIEPPPMVTIESGSTPIVGALVEQDYERALERADRALVQRPRSAWVRYNRGVALAGLGRIPEALDNLRDAEVGFHSPHERAIAAYRRALILEMAGRCMESANEYGHYAALVADAEPAAAAAAHSHVAFCIAPSVRQDEIRKEALRLRQAYDDRVHQQVELASTAAARALMRSDYEAALAQADIGLSVAPADPWLRYNRGAALAELGQVKAALKDLDEAEASFPTSETHGRAVATYRRALTLEVAGRCDEAREELEHYASLIGGQDPRFAAHAAAHLRFCRFAQAPRRTF